MKYIIRVFLIVAFGMFILGAFNKSTGQSLSIKNSETKKTPVAFFIDSNSAFDKKAILHFYYHDSSGYGHPVSFSYGEKQIQLNSPVFLLEANEKQTPFLVYPEEKICISFSTDKSVRMNIASNSIRNNELNFFVELIKKTGALSYYLNPAPYIRKVRTIDSVSALESDINKVKDARLKFMISYSQKFPISNKFSEIAINTIKSVALYDSLILYWNNRVLLEKKFFPRELIYSKLISIENLHFSSLIFDLKVTNALVSMAVTGNPYYIIRNSDDFVKKYDFVENRIKGERKFFLLYKALYDAYTNAIPVTKQYIHKFNEECKNEWYKKNIEEKLSENKTIIYPKGENNLRAANGTTITDIKTIMSRYKGKLIVVDFWASWCAPCRAEMQYSRKLKEKYSNISFIYISIDDNTDSWIKANEEECLGNDNSFLFLNYFDAPFKKQYNINTIPRYFLIGKDGEILNKDAPRPSDPRLKELIDKYLKQSS